MSHVGSEAGSLFGFADKTSFKQRVQMKKERNKHNQQLQVFRRAVQKRTVASEITLIQEKIMLIPEHIENDPAEALLYLYFCVRYLDEQLFKVVLTRASHLLGIQSEIQMLVKDARSYQRLTVEDSMDRFRFNQAVFQTALDKDYADVAFHFIENGYVHITWDMVRKMLDSKQEYLVKQCIKYQCKFDSGSANLKKVIFAGRTA